MKKVRDFWHWLSHYTEGQRGRTIYTWADRHPSEHHERHRGDCALDIMALLTLDYPNPAFALPRGAIARVAHDIGCSRSYASKVARNNGYHQAER
jgi:hypothetical protein